MILNENLNYHETILTMQDTEAKLMETFQMFVSPT